MSLFDAHCHLDLAAFDGDRDAVWARARAAGVRRALVPAVSPEGWTRVLATALAGERWAALGVHPFALLERSEHALRDALDALPSVVAAHRDLVVAVGECGLDATLDPSRAPMSLQRAVLAAQLQTAVTLGLPVVLHVRGAHREAIEVIAAQGVTSLRGVVHSYSGGVDLVPRYLSLGLHLGFGGAVTRPSARRPAASLRATPADRLLLETDAPDQLPAGLLRPSRRCEPADLAVILGHAAALRGVSPVALATHTEANARALFGV